MLVIGNGESRKNVNITNLDYYKIGCNAIHRDFRLDSIVCVDKRMVAEVLKFQYNKHSIIYTRREHQINLALTENIKVVPNLPYNGNKKWDEPRNWGSGAYAVLIAAMSNTETIKMLGFDLYSKDKFVNNVYKNSTNYAREESKAIDPRHWIYQISKVFEYFPNTEFKVYQHNEWLIPDSWKKHNVSLDSISKLV